MKSEYNFRGDKIPYVNYTDEENKTWKAVYQSCRKLNVKNACRQYINSLVAMEYKGVLSGEKAPQLKNLSEHLKGNNFKISKFLNYVWNLMKSLLSNNKRLSSLH